MPAKTPYLFSPALSRGLISMQIKIGKVILAIIFMATSSFAFSSSSNDKLVEEIVSRLGSIDNDDMGDIKRLSSTPRISAKILIDNLTPIYEPNRPHKENQKKVKHSLFILRALRYLTGGINFCNNIKHYFGNTTREKNREYWLHFHNKKCMTFFAYWMSRDEIYLAPVDVQKDIISKWKRWYTENRSTFYYVPLKNPSVEDWYWGE